ncbi:MAG TPA: hypothetical protein PKD64_01855 [Pirellulaceae bacterium]|nr:hypothetical protein [Pirellulaceae bacterium]HMO90915.1 hypothetical protein [Pirellulaceae bacterium]HMP68609.1 hypothetical protein [Pirellulaceae bacterium]
MLYRVPSSHFSSQAIFYANRLNSNVAAYQKQIASGMRLHRPSEEPVSFRQASSLTAQMEQLDADYFIIRDSESKLNQSVSILTEAADLLSTAKVLTQQGIQSLSQSERDALAIEVENILAGMKRIAQTQAAGAFIFGGARTNANPFTFGERSVAGGTLPVTYNGSEVTSRAFVGATLTVDTYYPGHNIFGRFERKDAQIFGSTGAKIGQGTANIIGRATLQVRHTETIFAPGSGIAAGTSSPGNDSIIGPSGVHFVEIIDTVGDGSAGTISLNGGPEFAFSNADTNLEIRDRSGNRIFVNTTNITAGFFGTVNIQANGTLSVDNGLSSLAIDFSSSQTVVDSTTNRFVHIDSTSIKAVGDDYLEFPGTSNAFQILDEIVQDLRGARNLSNADFAHSLDRRLSELDIVANNILDTVGRQSATLYSLRQLDSRVADFRTDAEERLSIIQSTNIADAIMRLTNDQNLLQYTYAITAQIASVQLLNFLR